MHRTEGPDDLAGMYTETPLGTIINKDAMNAIQEEIAGAIEDSGQTLAANGVSDESADWGQLSSAIADFDAAGVPKTESLRLINAAVPAEYSNFTMRYVRMALRRHLLLHFPNCGFVLAAPSSLLQIKTNAGSPAAVPASVRLWSYTSASIYFPLAYGDAVTTGGGFALASFNPNTNIFDISPVSGTQFTGSVNIYEQTCHVLGTIL